MTTAARRGTEKKTARHEIAADTDHVKKIQQDPEDQGRLPVGWLPGCLWQPEARKDNG